MRHGFRHIIGMMAIVWASWVAGCDSSLPSYEESLVVEAWIATDAPLPSIRVSAARATRDPLVSLPAPDDLSLKLTVGDQEVQYARSLEDPLQFQPQSFPQTSAGERFILELDAPGASLNANGILPPPIAAREVSVSFPGDPISVVLVNSLVVGLDSLNLSVSATTGYIYPVQVSISWEDRGYDGWIEARLQPDASFSSSLIDFFLLPSQVFPEDSATLGEDGFKHWEGVYAVPVPEEDSPFPDHSLRIVLTRGDDRFARFLTSRDAPERREPVSNVNGGLGFVGGIAMDSVRVIVSR
ncbi:MAG: hypothetical protein ACPG3U_02360 [Rhodothermales bacterium]